MQALIAVALVIAVVVGIWRALAWALADSHRKGIVEDPVLGTLFYDSTVRAWRAAIEAPAGRICFLIRGDSEPAAALVSYAREIASSAESFHQSIRDFLESEAVCQPVRADEIRSLKLNRVCLFWPDRPFDGVIHFDGPNGVMREWRCDYMERTPLALIASDS